MHEFLTWGGGIATLLGFGIAMGLNPALYGATADMLARRVQVRARLLWMVGGLATGATALLAIFHSLNPARLVAAARGELDAALVNRVVDVVVAVLFLALAAGMLIWKRRVPHLASAAPKRPRARARPAGYFLLGLGACIGFTTLPIMYLTGRLISGLTSDLALRAIAYGIFLLALAAPFFALAWAWSTFPSITDRITGFYAGAARWDYRYAFVGLFGVASLVFVAIAILGHRGS